MELPFGLRECLVMTMLPAGRAMFHIDRKLFVGPVTNDNANFDRWRAA